MRYLWLVLFIAFAPCASFGQNSEHYRACIKKARTQAQMNACASEEAHQVDIELNRIYHELVSKAEADPLALAKIRAAESAWIAYRDAYIDATYPAEDKQAEYGSVYPMQVDLLRAKLTQQQIAALKELLQHYSS